MLNIINLSCLLSFKNSIVKCFVIKHKNKTFRQYFNATYIQEVKINNLNKTVMVLVFQAYTITKTIL